MSSGFLEDSICQVDRFPGEVLTSDRMLSRSEVAVVQLPAERGAKIPLELLMQLFSGIIASECVAFGVAPPYCNPYVHDFP